MPHYKDGLEAKIGDVVRGKGYNVKGPDGALKEIVGTVVGLTPGSEVCNIQVAHVVLRDNDPRDENVVGCGANGGSDDKRVVAGLGLEYGECNHFELVAGPVADVFVDGVKVRTRGSATGLMLKIAAKRDAQYHLVQEVEGEGVDVDVKDDHAVIPTYHGERFHTHPGGTF